jgi:hypothetical protein
MYKDFFEGSAALPTEKVLKPLYVRVLLRTLFWLFLLGLGIFSFIFPPLGIPIAVLLYHNGKKRYAIFPTLGVVLLVIFTLFNQLMTLLTR